MRSRGRNPKFEWQDSFNEAEDLTYAEYRVGRTIADRWNGDNNHPYAPVDWLVSKTHFSERSVQRALASLRKKGWIAQTSRGGRRGDATWASRYRLTDPNVPSVSSKVPSVSSQPDMGGTPVDLPVDLHTETSPSARVGLTSDCRANCPWWTGDGTCCATTPIAFPVETQEHQ